MKRTRKKVSPWVCLRHFLEETMEFKFDPIEDILEEIRQGHIVIMQDAESREMKATTSAPQNSPRLRM